MAVSGPFHAHSTWLTVPMERVVLPWFGWWNVSSAGFPNPHLLGVCCPNLSMNRGLNVTGSVSSLSPRGTSGERAGGRGIQTKTGGPSPPPPPPPFPPPGRGGGRGRGKFKQRRPPLPGPLLLRSSGGEGEVVGSWSQGMRKSERGLSMNRRADAPRPQHVNLQGPWHGPREL